MVPEETHDPTLTYFAIQATMGTTKHMGGFESTRELIERCAIDQDSFVLDVGCGVGATACYLAETYGSRVMAVDQRQDMVDLARERARGMGLEELVTCRTADARELPFEDGFFDVVLCESVLTFVEDKGKALGEFARVTKGGGSVGLNEQYWIQPPDEKMVQYAQRIWGFGELPSLEAWREAMLEAGWIDVKLETYQIDVRRESSQIKRYKLGEIWGMFARLAQLYFKNAELRAYMKAQRGMPRGFFKHLGYGLFIGIKA